MKCSRIVRRDTESLDDIEARLEGRVFHVTPIGCLPDILRSGFVEPNLDGSRHSPFGFAANGFFRRRGCVSLFDYRQGPDDPGREYRYHCWPFQAATPRRGPIAILILNPEVYAALVPWIHWQKEQAWSQMVVPYVETGHEGPIPITMVDEVICVSLIENPDDFTLALTAHLPDTPNGPITRRMPTQLSGLYQGQDAGDYVIILQENVENTDARGFVVHVQVNRCRQDECCRGTVLVSDDTWRHFGDTDEARSNALGQAIVSWMADRSRYPTFTLHAVRRGDTHESAGIILRADET